MKVPVTSVVQPAGTRVAVQAAVNGPRLPKSSGSVPGSTRSTMSVTTQPEKQLTPTTVPEPEKDEPHKYSTGEDDAAKLVPDGFSDAETMEHPPESVTKDTEALGENFPQQLSPVMDDVSFTPRSLSTSTSFPKQPLEDALIKQSTLVDPPLLYADSEDVSSQSPDTCREFNTQQQEATDERPDEVKDANCFAFLKKPCGICVGSSARKLNSGN